VLSAASQFNGVLKNKRLESVSRKGAKRAKKTLILTLKESSKASRTFIEILLFLSFLCGFAALREKFNSLF
jgi:hypothetical protein